MTYAPNDSVKLCTVLFSVTSRTLSFLDQVRGVLCRGKQLHWQGMLKGNLRKVGNKSLATNFDRSLEPAVQIRKKEEICTVGSVGQFVLAKRRFQAGQFSASA